MPHNFYSAPPTYSQYIAKLMELKAQFPFIQVFPIGESVLGRQIFALSIGNTTKISLMAGAFHAQEWLTTTLLVRFFEDICSAFLNKQPYASSQICSALSTKGLLVVPMVNTDGVQIALAGARSCQPLSAEIERISATSQKSWQANANGVDLNHNFDAGFVELKQLEIAAGINSPSPRQYGGTAPHSEPETRAMVSLLHRYDVDTLYAFHSQGEEIYYEYGINTPPKSKYLAELFSRASGYTPVKNEGLCSHGGYKDYFIEKFARPGFTIEIGKGENPLPITMLTSIYSKLKEAFAIMTVL